MPLSEADAIRVRRWRRAGLATHEIAKRLCVNPALVEEALSGKNGPEAEPLS